MLPPIAHLDDGMQWRERQAQLLLLHEGLLALGHDSRVVCQHGSDLHERLYESELPHYPMRWLGRHDLLAARRLGHWARREAAILHAHTPATRSLAVWASRIGGADRIVSSAPADRGARGGERRPRPAARSRVGIHLVADGATARSLALDGIDARRIEVIPRGIDLGAMESVAPDHAWRTSLGLAPGELLVGTLFVNDEEHDPSAVVLGCELWRARSGAGRLVFVGDGDEALDDLLPRFAALDIFVGCARAGAPGTEVLEAMALARPVIAAGDGAAADWIESGHSGLLVDASSPRRMPELIADALGGLQSSAARRQSLGHAARERAQAFDLLQTVERTVLVYQRVIEP